MGGQHCNYSALHWFTLTTASSHTNSSLWCQVGKFAGPFHHLFLTPFVIWDEDSKLSRAASLTLSSGTLATKHHGNQLPLMHLVAQLQLNLPLQSLSFYFQSVVYLQWELRVNIIWRHTLSPSLNPSVHLITMSD